MLEFVKNHPALMTLIVWPLITGLLTAIFKPRTPEEYSELAENWPRLAAFWQLLGASGFDVLKAVSALQKLVAGRDEPPAPPTPRVLPPVTIISAIIVALGLFACASWKQDVKTVLDIAQVACVIAHQEMPDSAIASACGIADTLIPDMRTILAESRKQSANAAATRCPPR